MLGALCLQTRRTALVLFVCCPDVLKEDFATYCQMYLKHAGTPQDRGTAYLTLLLSLEEMRWQAGGCRGGHLKSLPGRPLLFGL